MKARTHVLQAIESRLTKTWAADLTGSLSAPAWPWAAPLGEPTTTELTTQFVDVALKAQAWRDWAHANRLELRDKDKRVRGTLQSLPTHVVIPDIDTAAALCAGHWPDRLHRGRARAAALVHRYPHLPHPARTVKDVDALSDQDFTLLCQCADWFAQHTASGLTPRQVPIEGLHAKWLNTRQALVRDLAGIQSLGLLPPHPSRIHFTYLDPAYRARGARRHDCATVGDAFDPPYPPDVVVISENKDTAIHFPPLPGGISVEGMGRGGGTAASFAWLTTAPRIIYWGDMDADGLEILDGFRAAGVRATSILMDPTAYQAWERFGTNLDAKGRLIQPRPPRPVPNLTDAERGLYHQLLTPEWRGHRRVEQERIPLEVALRHVKNTTPAVVVTHA